MAIYVDGEEIESLEAVVPYDSNEKLHIGGDPGCGGRSWYTGLLDDVRLYNRALSKAEIAILAENGGFAVDSAGKLATAWREIKEHN